MTMSTLTEDGVMTVKQTACDRLLNFRVDMKLAGKRIGDVLNRMHVAVPKARDNAARPPVIPPSVAAARAAAAAAAKPKRKTEKDLQEEHGGAGMCDKGGRGWFLFCQPVMHGPSVHLNSLIVFGLTTHCHLYQGGAGWAPL